ncbi:LacI family transcriptional regulator [Kribbella antibiotica]|uniref:LacI family transcriptional regulator n=1 Tax=Kribbella antibiotica TaxID=190195 RepID=A0A4R4YNF6_9ACTN|nr:LacI family DNA-binding transcriptional regulator [Kribbella antibiotica]TDD46625.1 LacI family transcriptional regulator [Kribbella antibiotica]
MASSTDGHRGKRPTITDIATAAGVSRGTVSRVLNNERWVSESARDAVERAIAETGYRPSSTARSLRGRRSHRVAFLINEGVDRLFADPNFAVLLQGISDALRERGSSIVLLMAGNQAERDHAVEFVEDGAVDGLFVISWHQDPEVVARIERTGIPLVSAGEPPSAAEVSWVSADDKEGAALATRYLLSLGRRRIVTIAGPDRGPSGDQRLAGYTEALSGEVDPRWIEVGDYSQASGAEAMLALLDRVPDLDAVFAANDVMAAGAIEALRQAGRRVPEDVAVVGFDDSTAATSVVPAITTMRQHFDVICKTAVELLTERIDGSPPRHVVVPTELVIRESTSS